MHLVNAQVLEQWNTLTDEQVVARVLGGHTALFELLMRRYNERVYRVARAMVRDEQEAEDVMQQAYVNAYVHLRQFNGRSLFSTWLTRIAINESLARLRRQRRHEPFDDHSCEAENVMRQHAPGDPEQQAVNRELRAVLEWAIDRLPEGGRDVFVLREVEGLSTAEAADLLGVSQDAVKTRLSRARAVLRRTLLARTGSSASEVFRFHRPRCDRVVALVLARIAAIPINESADGE